LRSADLRDARIIAVRGSSPSAAVDAAGFKGPGEVRDHLYIVVLGDRCSPLAP
jgi:hypothetical protein